MEKVITMTSFINNLTEMHGIADLFPACPRAFKQFQIPEILCIPPEKPDIEQITNIYVSIEIKKTTVVETARGTSFEGQILTGRKLIAEGFLHQKIEYIADDRNHSVHAAHFTAPFSTFIILEEYANCNSEYKVTGYIEDIYVKQSGKRMLFKNVMVLLNAVPVI
jgi:hypothetical protein